MSLIKNILKQAKERTKAWARGEVVLFPYNEKSTICRNCFKNHQHPLLTLPLCYACFNRFDLSTDFEKQNVL